jgi:hypothetical protein
MANGKKETAAPEILREQRRLAAGYRDSADAYLQAMESQPRPAVEVGGFYVTFDRSLVCVVRPYTRCTCPSCSGRTRAAVMLGEIVLPFAVPAPAPTEADAAPEAHDDGESPTKFVVSILRGGHGIKELLGEKPGEIYVVDAAGFTLQGIEPNGPGRETVSPAHLGMAGLSLCRRVHVKVVEDPAAVFPEMRVPQL